MTTQNETPDDEKPGNEKRGNEKRGDPERARLAMLEAIEAQLRGDDPPETRKTLERLMQQGLSREQAMKAIAGALIREVFSVLKHGSAYDRERYVANLKRLPRRPWDPD